MKKRVGFTLAEIMIVMLILTILLAAFTPLMTKRKQAVDTSNPWRWSANLKDAYFGMNNSSTAMIGSKSKDNTDKVLNPRFSIKNKNSTTQPFISFHSGDNTDVGHLFIPASKQSIYLTKADSGTTYNLTGIGNVAIGYNAGKDFKSNYNIAIGHNAMPDTTKDKDQNTAIGAFALQFASGANNTAIGAAAAQNLDRARGENVAIGKSALYSAKINGGTMKTEHGHKNVAVGNYTIQNNKLGYNNVAVGHGALHSNQDGYYNVAVGSAALYNNKGILSTTTGGGIDGGYSNVAVGRKALYSSVTGNHNTAVGAEAMQYNLGQSNVAIGFQALNGSKGSNGGANVAVGYGALKGITSGNYNTALGADACVNVKTKSKVTCIGYGSGPSSDDDAKDSTIYLGRASDTVYIPGNLVVGGSTILGLEHYGFVVMRGGVEGDGAWGGNGHHADRKTVVRFSGMYNVTAANGYYTMQGGPTEEELNVGGFTIKAYSDNRLKNINGNYTDGLDKIRQLKVYNYTFKDDKTKTPHVGVVAQELKKIFPQAVFEDKSTKEKYLLIRKEDMFYAMVNAIKELDTTLQNLVNQVKEITVKIANYDTKIKALEKENKELKSKIQTLEKQNKSIVNRQKSIEKKLKSAKRKMD